MPEAYHTEQAKAVRLNVAADAELPDIQTTRFDVASGRPIAVSAFAEHTEARED